QLSHYSGNGHGPLLDRCVARRIYGHIYSVDGVDTISTDFYHFGRYVALTPIVIARYEIGGFRPSLVIGQNVRIEVYEGLPVQRQMWFEVVDAHPVDPGIALN